MAGHRCPETWCDHEELISTSNHTRKTATSLLSIQPLTPNCGKRLDFSELRAQHHFVNNLVINGSPSLLSRNPRASKHTILVGPLRAHRNPMGEDGEVGYRCGEPRLR